ncbi:NAD(P)H-dependent oxidoreductase [Duganella sp. Dugasp56]|jgi:FMN-dependent NADH-azoreductase|uniref:NAD(P)H-dependent oxidoreductase n=1 Tax=unclassified Duganella TaxID=2636909 RepID=UPI00159DDD58
MNILHIDSCPLGDNSPSRQYTAAVMAQLAGGDANPAISYRDVAASPLSHISGPLLQVIRNQWNSAIPMNADLRAESTLAALLLEEFLQADAAVIAAPMFNYTIPSTLKAWLDRLIHLQTDQGRQRAARIRVVLVVAGCSAATDPALAELVGNHEAQLRAMFKSLGLTQLEFVRQEADLQVARELKAAA